MEDILRADCIQWEKILINTRMPPPMMDSIHIKEKIVGVEDGVASSESLAISI